MVEENLKYPIKFHPILQEKIWGGTKLVTDFNKVSDSKKIGESWEISGLEGWVSEVSNGELKGCTLTQIVKKYGKELLGEKVYNNFGGDFPLLFKFIDASDDLSVQLHPNDELAKYRHNSFGKTEMWYVLDATEDSKLYAGFSKQYDKESYLKKIDSEGILDMVHVDSIKKGDSFFIEVGTIHAIGKGALIAEIQQTSNITYRIYDWDRVDNNGNTRELHTDLALDALDFSKVGSCKIDYETKLNQSVNICTCKYFTTNKLVINKDLQIELSSRDSFLVYMCVEGDAIITINDNSEEIKKGESVLIPACVDKIDFSTNKKASLLEIYIENEK
ncbi:type I phosphomannose isomerase catalytic subunit [Tenacibaculum sp. 190524A02b]|uniref:type I phosphomannose isomerase catalytic subunit n=1 Tax=Tenacibaculum vairaonense TaxID=3137860 RepID=UPI0031FB00AD